MEPQDYQDWLAGGQTLESPVVAGERLFEQYSCKSCHQAADGQRGPALEGLMGSSVSLADGSRVIADEEYLRESILNPNAKMVEGYRALMPSFRGLVSEESLLQLIAYIKSLTPTQVNREQS
jgi:cytochrome c oxidase subunit 2